MTIVCFVIRKRNKAPDITKFLEVLYIILDQNSGFRH